jgi:hypothetical protein
LVALVCDCEVAYGLKLPTLDAAYALEATARKAYLHRPIHDLELPVENLRRIYRLQSWTLQKVR